MGLILDTSALVAWERAQNAGLTLALDDAEELVMPAVVWAEALAGVRLANSAARAARRMARLEALRRVRGERSGQPGSDAGKSHFPLEGRLHRNRRPEVECLPHRVPDRLFSSEKSVLFGESA